MAIEDYAAPQQTAQANVRTINPPFSGMAYVPVPVQRPASELWLKTGYVGADGRFVGLPLDQPLDNMRPGDAGRSQSPAFVALIEAQNEFLKTCLEIGADLAPGEEVVIGGLEVRIRRANQRVEAAKPEQPVDLKTRLTVTKIVKPAPASA